MSLSSINVPRQRLQALDVFRGMTIFLMIIVNTQGSGAVPYSQLMHAEWNGFTLTDLVFPSFLFAVGNALAFVKTPSVKKIVKRSVLIFVAGVALSWYSTMHFTDHGIAFVPVERLRIMAVLQRIALCYYIAALLALVIRPTILSIVAVVILTGYWGMLYFGGTSGDPYGPTTNLVRTIDLAVLGEAHMYREHGLLFDPEGLLSTLPATVNVIAGYVTGVFLLEKGRVPAAVVRPAIAGIVLTGIGWGWGHWFPLNKKLWTSSFVLVTTGIDLVWMAGLFYLIEIRRWKRGVAFFTVLGKNPLSVYVFSNLLLIFLIWPVGRDTIGIDWINAVFFQKLVPGPLGALFFSVVFAMLCWTLAWWMDRKKIYLRL